MEIKKETFVVVVAPRKRSPQFGIVEKVILEASAFSIETETGPEFGLKKDAIIPLAQNCKTIQDGWQKHQPEIIMNLAVMIHDLQKQVKELQTSLQFQRTGPGGTQFLQNEIKSVNQEIESLKKQTQWLAENKKTRGNE